LLPACSETAPDEQQNVTCDSIIAQEIQRKLADNENTRAHLERLMPNADLNPYYIQLGQQINDLRNTMATYEQKA
jgi:hypothetical protein